MDKQNRIEFENITTKSNAIGYNEIDDIYYAKIDQAVDIAEHYNNQYQHFKSLLQTATKQTKTNCWISSTSKLNIGEKYLIKANGSLLEEIYQVVELHGSIRFRTAEKKYGFEYINPGIGVECMSLKIHA